MTKKTFFLPAVVLCIVLTGNFLMANPPVKIYSSDAKKELAKTDANKPSVKMFSADPEQIRLKNKIIPISNPVYQVLDFYATSGELGFVPLAKPYTKIYVIELLNRLLNTGEISENEKTVISRHLADLTAGSNSLEIYRQRGENSFLLAGTEAGFSVRNGFGDKGSWSISALLQPFVSGDLGEHLTFTGGIGFGGEQLSPDLFYQSYTRNSAVVFPHEKYGVSFLPYQFRYNTNYTHYNRGWSPPVDNKLQIALFYTSELNASWFDGKLRASINNRGRTWGHAQNNLFLSASARRFPALELQVFPFSWFRYSYLVGSLFYLPADHGPYKQPVYGEDLGRAQKNLSAQMVELIPWPWLQLSGAANAIWPKRFELTYLMPFVVPSMAQDNLGDQDNPALYFDIATRFKGVGKTWLGVYLDDFSFADSSGILKRATSKYAWQAGWKTNLLSALIPGTSTCLQYTRVTPFVYTHYPENDFTFGNNRPIDMTYTHDGMNLGFYLPPNSGELNLSFTNIAIPDLLLTLDNRLIVHGTNDLASNNKYLIYGDIYRHSAGGINQYPLLDFTDDGIYDWSVQTEFTFDWKIRANQNPRYYRLTGSIGYSKTWWESNNSGVGAPASQTLLTGSIGIIVEM